MTIMIIMIIIIIIIIIISIIISSSSSSSSISSINIIFRSRSSCSSISILFRPLKAFILQQGVLHCGLYLMNQKAWNHKLSFFGRCVLQNPIQW